MHALQLTAPRRFERIAIDQPPRDLPPGHARVRLEVATVCGSDLPFFTGRGNLSYPLAPGLSIHECIGRVEESTSKTLRPGDRVLAVPFHHHGLFETLDLPEERVFSLGDDADDGLVLAQPLATVLWAWRKVPSLMGKNVVVLGQGPIGLFFNHLAAQAGARHVIGVDVVPYRLEMGRRMGATATVNAAEGSDAMRGGNRSGWSESTGFSENGDGEQSGEAVTRLVHEMTSGQMADVVIEAVGHQTGTVEQAIDLAAEGGTILLFGVPTKERYPFLMDAFFRKNLDLRASVRPDLTQYAPLAIEMIRRGTVDPSGWITHRFSVDQIAEAFTLVEQKADGVLKPLVTFDW